jgi:hypothetical protein
MSEINFLPRHATQVIAPLTRQQGKQKVVSPDWRLSRDRVEKAFKFWLCQVPIPTSFRESFDLANGI